MSLVRLFAGSRRLSRSYIAASKQPVAPAGGTKDRGADELPEAASVTWSSAERAAQAEKDQRGSPVDQPAEAVNAAQQARGTGPEITSDDTLLDAARKIGGRVVGALGGEKVLDAYAASAKKGLDAGEVGTEDGLKERDVLPKSEKHDN